MKNKISYLMGSAFVETQEWPKVKSKFKLFESKQWESDTGNGISYCQFLIKKSADVEKIKKLILKNDSAFEFVEYKIGSNPEKILAVVDLRIVPRTYKITYYYQPSEWKIIAPKIKAKNISVDIQENASGIKIDFSFKDRVEIKKITDESIEEAKSARSKSPVYVISFFIKNSREEGHCAVGTKTAKLAEELFKKKIVSLLKDDIDDVNLKEIIVDEVSTLKAHEKKMGDYLPQEYLPAINDVILFDFGT